MAQLFTNNAEGTLSVAVSSAGQTTLTLNTGKGAKFPSPTGSDYCKVTIDDGTNVEICICTSRTADVLTVTRGQEGTTAQSSFAIGSKVELRVTAAVMTALANPVSPVGSIIYAQANLGGF